MAKRQQQTQPVRDQVVTLRLSQQERERLEEMARGRGSTSDFIRSRVFGERTTLRQIAALHNLGMRLKEVAALSPTEVAELLALIRKTIRQLAKAVDDDR